MLYIHFTCNLSHSSF